jgi:glycerol-3-phosphate dehydrogenase
MQSENLMQIETVDVFIIGGGINGAGIAADALNSFTVGFVILKIMNLLW